MAELSALGAEVRARRKERGLTLKELARSSGVSIRYLSDLERGLGNISVARLLEVADALEVSLASLVAPLDAQRARRPVDRSVALVGLRGAGKTSIGQRLAEELGRPFIELDGEIESRAGLPLSQIFELHGEPYYRRLEREAVLDLAADPRPSVIAAGGGVVTDAASWGALRRATRTVWLRARPEEHLERVMAQGDLRPMRNRPAAMAELRSLLAGREPRYAEADLTVDTTRSGVEGAVSEIAAWLRPESHA